MAKKVTLQGYENRFKASHKNEDFDILNYTAVSKPVDIKCNRCGKIHHYMNANRAIKDFHCCLDNSAIIKNIKETLKLNSEFDSVSQTGSDVIIKHNKCGNCFKRDINSFFSSPLSCVLCSNCLYDAQEQVDEIFSGSITLIEYHGQSKKCKYRCNKCGQIFIQRFDKLIASSGCPKCK